MALVGGYKPIRNVRSPHVAEIGKFAVAEHNKQAGQELVFVRVVRGARLVVAAGTTYRLVIEAEEGDAKKLYYGVVYDRRK